MPSIAETRSCSLFFFQAEDGIRDYKVTGVQTCALPILALHQPHIGAQARQALRSRGHLLERGGEDGAQRDVAGLHGMGTHHFGIAMRAHADRKSTRLNSSHLVISYAVFCLKKKKTKKHR